MEALVMRLAVDFAGWLRKEASDVEVGVDQRKANLVKSKLLHAKRLLYIGYQ